SVAKSTFFTPIVEAVGCSAIAVAPGSTLVSISVMGHLPTHPEDHTFAVFSVWPISPADVIQITSDESELLLSMRKVGFLAGRTLLPTDKVQRKGPRAVYCANPSAWVTAPMATVWSM